MSFFVGLFGSKRQSTQTAAAAGVNVQTSVSGKPIPLVYGTTRIACNYLWYGAFQAIQQQSNSGGGGGKGGVGGGGGGKGGGGSVNYQYYASFIAGLCEGPVNQIGQVWLDKNINTLAGVGESFFNGSLGQAPWSYLVSNFPTQAIGYNKTAYVAAANYSLGTSPQLPNFNYEVYGLLQGTAPNTYDADPSQVIPDLLDNPVYGVGLSSGYIGNLSTYKNYCLANGLWVSPYYDSQTMLSTMLDDLAVATNSAIVWSAGQLNIVPYGDQSITANGYTYTAPSSPLYSLGDDDFMRNAQGGNSNLQSDNPLQISRKRPSDAYNGIKVEYLDRSNNYQPNVAEANDLASILVYGLRQAPVRTHHFFCDSNAAQLSARLQLYRQQIRNIYSFQLDQRYIVLDPMDIVAVTDTTQGIVNQWVRITEITENDDMSISVIAEEYIGGTGNAPLFNYQVGLGYAANYNTSPGNTNIPVIWEPTDALAGGLEIWISASGANPSIWGGCDVYISTDGTTYANAGRINGASRQGVLTAGLSSVTSSATGQTIDQANTLSVSLSQSAGSLLSGSQADALALSTLCYVDGEYIAYETATLTSSNAYNLTFLVRGAYDTTISSHAVGSQFARIDNGIFKFSYASPLIGTTVLIKLVSFNIWGGGYQSIADVEPYTYIVQGTAFTSALPNVTSFATAYVAGLTQLIWEAVSDFRPVDYEVRQGSTWASGNILYRTPLLQGPISGDGTYWVAAHFKVPNGGADIYSETPSDLTITGSQITQNVIASYDQASTGWSGTFSSTVITSLGLQLQAAGNILTDPDYLNTADILYYGGVVSSGTYTIPSSQIVNIGRIAPCQIIMTMGVEVGYSLNAVNILSLMDYLNAQNILGVDLGNNTSVTPQIQLSQDGSTFGAWQNWIPGSYSAKAFNGRVVLNTLDLNVLAVLTDFTFTVDVPSLIQSGSNVSIASSGSSIVYPSTYNGGINGTTQPNLQVTILNASAGDDAIVTSSGLSGFSIEIVNSGSPVSRSVNWVAQGF